MFRTATAIAVAALFCAPAMAQTVTKGQYRGVTQYTTLTDFSGACTGIAGLAAGQLTTTVATVTGLGAPWTSTIANLNPTPTAAYGAGWINCHFPTLPATGAFTGTATTGFTAAPTGPDVTTCVASNGIAYTLTSGNGASPLGDGTQQTETVTLLPANGTGADSGYKLTTTNTLLSAGGSPLCYLSTDALYLLVN
jgi:hypothetical protein